MAGVVKVGPWGGNGGTAVDVGSASRIKRILVRSGDVVDGMRVYYIVDGTLFDVVIGGTGGSESQIDLPNGEYLNSMSGYVNAYGPGITCVTQLSFATNKGTKYGPYGRGGGTPFSLPVADGKIANFFGRGGNYVDACGAYLGPK